MNLRYFTLALAMVSGAIANFVDVETRKVIATGEETNWAKVMTRENVEGWDKDEKLTKAMTTMKKTEETGEYKDWEAVETEILTVIKVKDKEENEEKIKEEEKTAKGVKGKKDEEREDNIEKKEKEEKKIQKKEKIDKKGEKETIEKMEQEKEEEEKEESTQNFHLPWLVGLGVDWLSSICGAFKKGERKKEYQVGAAHIMPGLIFTVLIISIVAWLIVATKRATRDLEDKAMCRRSSRRHSRKGKSEQDKESLVERAEEIDGREV